VVPVVAIINRAFQQEEELPLYEYQCRKCGATIEKIQKFSDPPLEVCEACGGELERLVSSPAIQFKGSGWYVTDYARKSSAGDPARSSSASSSSSTSETKKEPTPAAPKTSSETK
jgi:putative FmdB family regulatory protein